MNERLFTKIRTESDVTEELRNIVRSVVVDHYLGTHMDMSGIEDHIEDHVLVDGTYPDLGEDMTSPAMNEVMRFAMRVRNDPWA